MEVRFGKWEKNGMQRIYFNSEILGDAKIFAYADANGDLAVKEQGYEGMTADSRHWMSKVSEAGFRLLEEKVGKSTTNPVRMGGKPKDYATFADVWAAV